MTGNELSNSALSLDALCAQARVGDSRAETDFFENLRVRFHVIAKRRVQTDDVEDIIQDAIQIVHRKYKELENPTGILVWSLTVLRNIIGNYYQAKKREAGHISIDDHTREAGVPMGILLWDDKWNRREADSDLVDQIVFAIHTLSQRDLRCGKIFQKILKSMEFGNGQREISQRALNLIHEDFPDISRSTFYVVLHRCRSRLREVLLEMEGTPLP